MILLKSAFFHMEEINKSKLKEQIAELKKKLQLELFKKEETSLNLFEEELVLFMYFVPDFC